MNSSKRFFSGLLLVLVNVLSGCKAFESLPLKESSLLTHQQIKQPPELTPSQSLLWVGLEAYLGRGTKDDESSAALYLKTAGQPLVLIDANGIKHKSAEIRITWRQVTLQIKKHLERQVAGPFASFESAQVLATNLRKLGLDAVVAHPKDWEVWLPDKQGLPLHMDIKFRTWKESITSEIKPVLNVQTGGRILLSGPVRIEALDGAYFEGGVYQGPFVLQPDAYGSWSLVEQVPLERYLQGVVPHEIGVAAPSAALEAQAVLARTWAVANSNRFVVDGFHLCSDTQCQVYKDPRQATDDVKSAIANTVGKVLSWEGKPINAVYHASNGGVSANGNEAWLMNAVPYLRARLDGTSVWKENFSLPLTDSLQVKSLLEASEGAYGINHPRFRWSLVFSAEQLKELLRRKGIVMESPKAIKVLERGRSGRVLALQIRGDSNEPPVVLRIDEIRRILRNLPSTLFVLNQLDEMTWEVIGGGFGHGVGLSQAGAIDLARRGWTTEEILSHYYPGTNFGPLPD